MWSNRNLNDVRFIPFARNINILNVVKVGFPYFNLLVEELVVMGHARTSIAVHPIDLCVMTIFCIATVDF
jgi:hypothetical protein